MTLPRLNKMLEHWKRWPPVHITAALFAGVKTEVAPRSEAAANDNQITNADVVRESRADARKVQWKVAKRG